MASVLAIRGCKILKFLGKKYIYLMNNLYLIPIVLSYKSMIFMLIPHLNIAEIFFAMLIIDTHRYFFRDATGGGVAAFHPKTKSTSQRRNLKKELTSLSSM